MIPDLNKEPIGAYTAADIDAIIKRLHAIEKSWYLSNSGYTMPEAIYHARILAAEIERLRTARVCPTCEFFHDDDINGRCPECSGARIVYDPDTTKES